MIECLFINYLVACLSLAAVTYNYLNFFDKKGLIKTKYFLSEKNAMAHECHF